MKTIQLLRLISIINSLLIIPACSAQNPSESLLKDVLEDLSVNNGTDNSVNTLNWENELEELSNRMQEPVNLNVATREQLEQFPFLSDIQIEHLLAYIYIHGQMKTIYELQLVEEMDKQTIQYLLPFVCIKAINNESAFRWKSLLKNAAKYGKNELLTRFDIPFYKRKGYEHTYLGPSVYNSVKYSFRYSDRLYAGVVAEKDAGEPFGALHNRYGYDYYSFYLLLKDCGRLKALAVGNYRLSFGQGLVISTDYLMGKTVYASSFNNRNSGIKKHSSADEYNYFRGVAATVSLTKDWDISGFYSHRSLDGVITDGTITSPVLSLSYSISDDHQRCLGDSVLLRCLRQCTDSTAEGFFLRPACLVNDCRGGIFLIAAGDQLSGQFLQKTCAQKDNHGRLMCRETSD